MDVSAKTPIVRRRSVTRLFLGVVAIAVASGLSGFTRPLSLHASAPPPGQWTAISPLSGPRVGLAAASTGGLVYAIGGSTADGQIWIGGIGATGVTSVEAFDPSTGTWSPRAPLPEARVYSAGASVIDGRIYVVGGTSPTAWTNTLFIFDPTDGPIGSWTVGPALPEYSLGGASAVIDDQLYVVGGFGHANNLWRFDPVTQSWSAMAGLPWGHSFFAAAAVGGKLYVTGGEGNTGVMDIYDPATNSWTTKFMPVGYQHHAAAVFGGRLYLLGGNQDFPGSGCCTQTRVVMSYDPITDSWSAGPIASAGGPYSGVTGSAVSFSGSATSVEASVGFARNLPAAAATQDGLYLLGGGSDQNTEILSSAESATPPGLEAPILSWDFGDGYFGTGASPSHVYLTAGTYQVTLTASAPDGPGSTSTAQVTISNGQTDTTPPMVTCGSADGVWHATDVSIACSASDADSGLANSADASFALMTTVTAGAQTANASTGARTVCDNAGNCATAGPIGANMIDKRAPFVSLAAPVSGSYTIGQVVLASYGCSDGGSGLASCAGPVASGAPIDTSTAGLFMFTVNSVDGAGNAASVSLSYTVSLGGTFSSVTPASIWLGLKNSDDVGTKFDLLAEVLKNGTVIGSGQLNAVPGGNSGFNNAVQRAVTTALAAPTSIGPGDMLSIRLSVRIADGVPGHVSGTARLWYNDAAANSRIDAIVNGVARTFYFQSGSVLSTTLGTGPKATMDVLVNKNVGGNPFKPFGTWSIVF